MDLVKNGEYQGLYWLGEVIKVDENRVDINDGSDNMDDDEDKDYLIRMDTHYDEIVKPKSAIRDLAYMKKKMIIFLRRDIDKKTFSRRFLC